MREDNIENLYFRIKELDKQTKNKIEGNLDYRYNKECDELGIININHRLIYIRYNIATDIIKKQEEEIIKLSSEIKEFKEKIMNILYED